MKNSHLLLLSFCLGAFLGTASAEEADVVVVGATPAGISAAVAAARSGATVILVEEKNHVGGIVSGGLTIADIINRDVIRGLYAEFTKRIVAHYTDTYGADSKQLKDCREGLQFEPRVAESIFNQLLSAESRVKVVLQQRLASVDKDGDHLKAVHTKAQGSPKPEMTFTGKVFVDATYEGDLAAMAGAAYRTGRESRAAYGEPHAGHLYMKFGTTEPLPGSTGEADPGIEAFCFRFHVTNKPENRVPLEKPQAFNRDDYRHLIADIQAGKVRKVRDVMQLWGGPNDKYQTNSDHPDPIRAVPSESFDLAEENWGWTEAGPEDRARIFQRYWDYSEGLFWFLQNDPIVPESVRNEAAAYGLPKDEFTDNRHRPWHIYVREGRRIEGVATVTERSADLDPATGKPRPSPAGIAVAEYPFDCHGVHKYDPAHPGVREGYHYIKHAPFDLPYGILVPKKVDGLLVPVACSASHVAYQSIRMEPLFMVLGEASGIAAAMASSQGIEVRQVPVEPLRQELVKRGNVVNAP